LLLLLSGLTPAIFFLSRRHLFSFVPLRLPILRGEWRSVVFRKLQTRLHRHAKHCGQEPRVSFLICFSMLLLPGSGTFLVLEMAKNASPFARIYRAGFLPGHRVARKGDFQ